MNYGDHYPSSSYRKIFGDSPRFSASPLRLSGGSTRGSASSGFRSLASSRNNASCPGFYRGSFRPLSFSPVPSDCLDLAQASVLNNEIKVTRTNEKEQLQGLNDRFAVFIDKVRNVEQQNKVLEAELVTLRQKQHEPSRLADLYQQEMRDLRAQVEELSSEKNHMLMERDSIEEDLQKLRGRYEDEVRAREDAEQTLRLFKKDVDDATVARLDLERKVESLLDEISFLRKVHDEEIHDLSAMVQASHVLSVEVDLSKPDLTSALKEIRHSYDTLATKNLQSAEEWYKSKFASLNEQASRHNEAIRTGREEINEFRRQLQSRTIEVETLKGTNESLERQIREMEDAHNAEVAAMQDTIVHMDNELRNSKGEMAQHLREYQDLLNIKMALDIEITAYRKLLEGEETHFGTGMSYGAANHSVNYLPLPSAGSSPPSPSSSPSSSRKSRKKEAARKESLKETADVKVEKSLKETAEVKVEKNEEADLNSNS